MDQQQSLPGNSPASSTPSADASFGTVTSAEHVPGLSDRPWTTAEILLLGTMSDKKVAARVGRTTKDVRFKRALLGIRLSGVAGRPRHSSTGPFSDKTDAAINRAVRHLPNQKLRK